MTKNRTTNPVKEAARDFGGQTKLARLFSMHGIEVHKQTVSQWCSKGEIPSRYERAIRVLVSNYKQMLRDPSGLIESVKSPDARRDALSSPNLALQKWFDDRGGVGAFLSDVNHAIKQENVEREKRAKQTGTDFNPLKKWTYVMVYNWIKRGKVSENFRSTMVDVFGCPPGILGPESTPEEIKRFNDRLLKDFPQEEKEYTPKFGLPSVSSHPTPPKGLEFEELSGTTIPSHEAARSILD